MAVFIAFLKPVRPATEKNASAADQALVRSHFEYLQDLLREGVVVVAGRTDEPEPAGLVIFEAVDEAAARGLVLADPAVRDGLFTARLAPFRLALLRGQAPG